MLLLEYDDNHPVFIQHPANTKITLKRHQLVLLERCLKLENDKHRAMIGDKVGSGKSYLILSIINLKRGTNALVIPEHLLSQWIGYIDTYGYISYCVIKDYRSMTGLSSVQKRVDLVVIIQLMSQCVKCIDYEPFDRVFYDEIPNMDYLIRPNDNMCYFGSVSARFTWIVSASYEKYRNEHIVCIKNKDPFVDQYMSIPEPEVHKIPCHSHVLNVLQGLVDEETILPLHAGAIQEILLSFGKEHLTIDNIIQRFLEEKKKQLDNHVRSREKMLDELTLRLKEPSNRQIKRDDLVNLPATDPVFSRKEGPSAIEGRDPTAPTGPSVHTIKKEIDRLTGNIESLKIKIAEVERRITEEEMCTICCNNQTDALTECCYNRFCSECMVIWRRKMRQCPHCRSDSFTVVKIQVEKEEDGEKEKEEEGKGKEKGKGDGAGASVVDRITAERASEDKNDTVRCILEMFNDPGSRFLISSDYSGSFASMKQILRELNIDCQTLDNGWQEDIRLIDDFRQGRFKALLANAKHYGQGLNLEFVTDLICLHNSQNLKQIVGRAQRVGRKGPLRIWYLQYQSEMGDQN